MFLILGLIILLAAVIVAFVGVMGNLVFRVWNSVQITGEAFEDLV